VKIPEGDEIENLEKELEKIMAENFLNMQGHESINLRIMKKFKLGLEVWLK
jgi:hypothetical protein